MISRVQLIEFLPQVDVQSKVLVHKSTVPLFPGVFQPQVETRALAISCTPGRLAKGTLLNEVKIIIFASCHDLP